MLKPVLSSSLLVSLLAVAACPLLPPGTGTDPDNDDDVCTCVEGECIAPQELATATPEAPREQPAGLEDLSSANCQITATDELERPVGYRCFDAEDVVIVYGDDGHFESITTTSLVNAGQVEFRSFVWENDLLLAEIVDNRSDGVVQFRERRTFNYEGTAVVRLEQTLSGADDVVQLTAIATWDTAGHALRSEQRDAAGAITSENDYHWDGDLYLGVTSALHNVDPASAPGCTEVEPRVMRCEITVTYDAGEPISMTRDGETVSISDECCSLFPCSA
jgi:hypothetical protein